MIEKKLLQKVISKTKEIFEVRPFNIFFNEEKKVELTLVELDDKNDESDSNIIRENEEVKIFESSEKPLNEAESLSIKEFELENNEINNDDNDFNDGAEINIIFEDESSEDFINIFENESNEEFDNELVDILFKNEENENSKDLEEDEFNGKNNNEETDNDNNNENIKKNIENNNEKTDSKNIEKKAKDDTAQYDNKKENKDIDFINWEEIDI